MKRSFFLLIPFLVVSFTVQAQNLNNRTATVDSTAIPTTQEASYAMGVYFSHSLLTQMQKMPGGKDMSIKDIMKGIEDVLVNKQSSLAPEVAVKKLDTYLNAKQQEINEKNKQEGETFLAANANKEGVITTKSGLQYMIMEKGNGPRATVEDTVRVHYKGSFLDGQEFDSSYKSGEPVKINPLQVIPGWTEGLCLLPEGSKARLFIPADLAYGAQGVGSMIPPFSTLIFDIEVLGVIKGKPIPMAESSDEEHDNKTDITKKTEIEKKQN